MKFTIARGELFDTLTVAGKGLSARSTLPILSGLLISAADGSVVIQATDLEISVRSSVPALVEGEGTCVVSGKLLTDIVRSLPEAAVTLSVEKDIAVVSCGQSSFTLKTLSPDDFPKFPEVEVDKKVDLPASVLASVAKNVSKAVSRDETRPILTGILLVLEGPTLKMVATDSYRLAVSEVVLDTTPADEMEVVIPGKALEEATRLLAGVENISIGLSENQVVFEFGNNTFVTRRIEGSFPNYKQLIPKEPQTTVTLSSEELSAAVRRVSIMAQHNTPLKMSVNAEDQTLSLSATTQDVGDASEDLMVKATGPDVEIAFNHAFLADGLSSLNAEETTIEIVSSLKPGIIRPVGQEGFIYLLMPVRLG